MHRHLMVAVQLLLQSLSWWTWQLLFLTSSPSRLSTSVAARMALTSQPLLTVVIRL